MPFTVIPILFSYGSASLALCINKLYFDYFFKGKLNPLTTKS
jgi:hypothetical protein